MNSCKDLSVLKNVFFNLLGFLASDSPAICIPLVNKRKVISLTKFAMKYTIVQTRMAKDCTHGQPRSPKKYTLTGGTLQGTFTIEEPSPSAIHCCCKLLCLKSQLS